MPPGDDLERFRQYLELLARVRTDPRLRGKVDLSGVVQQTLLEAHQAAKQADGLGDEQRLAWLRRILANNLTDEIGAHLGRSPAAVAGLLHRGLHRLRELLQEAV